MQSFQSTLPFNVYDPHRSIPIASQSQSHHAAYSPTHDPSQLGAQMASHSAGGAPISLSHNTPGTNSSFDTFDQIDWQWSHRPVPVDQHVHYPYQLSDENQGYGSPSSPSMNGRQTMFSGSPSSYGPLSSPSTVSFSPGSPPIMSQLDGSHYSPHNGSQQQGMPLSSSLPVSPPVQRISTGAAYPFPTASPPEQHRGIPVPLSPLQTQAEWVAANGSEAPTRVIRRRTVRKSESDNMYDPNARIHHRSMSGGGRNNYLMPSSPLSRGSPSLAGVLISSGPGVPSNGQPTSPRMVSSSQSPQMRGIATSASAAPNEPIVEAKDEPPSDTEEMAIKRPKRKSLEIEEDGPKKSMLQPPKASPSTWQIYFTDQLQLYRARNPDQKLNVAQAAKELAQEYKRLSTTEKEPYKRRALLAKAERDRLVSEWERTLTPDDVRAENQFRAAQRKGGKSRKANMKDPNAPKKPLSAYFMFLQRIRSSPDMVREVFGEEQGTTKQSVLAAEKWRSMTDDEKKPFLARAEQEKLIYEAARREYEESFAEATSGNGEYMSGHFVGIETLSLDDTFILTAPIKAFQTGSPKKLEAFTADDLREAHEASTRERYNS